MTLREIQREALGLSPAERVLLAEIILRSLGQALEQLGRSASTGTTATDLGLEARVDSVFAQAFSGPAVELTDERWDRIFREEPSHDSEPNELDRLALPPAK